MIVAMTYYGQDTLIVIKINESTILVENELEAQFEIKKTDVLYTLTD